MDASFADREARTAGDLIFESNKFLPELQKAARQDLRWEAVAAFDSSKNLVDTCLRYLDIIQKRGGHDARYIEFIKNQLQLAKDRKDVVLGSLLNPSLERTKATALINGTIALAERILKDAETSLS